MEHPEADPTATDPDEIAEPSPPVEADLPKPETDSQPQPDNPAAPAEESGRTSDDN